MISRQQIIKLLSGGLLLVLAANNVAADAVTDGLGYLQMNQGANGLWGDPDGTQLRDSAVILETLALLGQNGSAMAEGGSGLAGLAARNNDDRARKTGSQTVAGLDVDDLITELLAAQGPEIPSASDPNYPGRGWGIADGFGVSPLDTAITLRGLEAAGMGGGLSVVADTVAALGSSPARSMQLPALASDFFLKVRSLSGNARFTLVKPDLTSLFVDLTPGGTPISIGPLPLDEGEWSLIVENQTGIPIEYTAELGYTDADGFDVFRLTTARTYLAETQNVDGGWPLAAGMDSHLMVSAEVLRTLARTGDFAAPSVLANGAAFLETTYLNPDGGFSSAPNDSNVNESALATLAIGLANPLAAALGSAAAYLEAQQLGNSSWNDNAYQTAMAMQALLLLTPRPAPQLTSNGGAGPGAAFMTDQAEVVITGIIEPGIVDLLVNLPGASVVIDHAAGTFEITVSIAEGLNNISISSVDGYGNPGMQGLVAITRDSSLEGQDLVLSQGLNLVGLRLDLVNPTGAIDLLEILGPGVSKVQRLDSGTGLYETTERDGIGGFTGSNFALAGLDGLLISSDAFDSAPATIHLPGTEIPSPSVDLVAGLNAITIPNPPATLDAFELLALIGDELVVSTLQRFNTVTGRFETALYRSGVPAGVNFPIEPGISYRVSMLAALTDFELPVAIITSVSILSPADQAVFVGVSSVTVSGTVSGVPPLTVVVNGIPATVAAGAFSASVPVALGMNNLTAIATAGDATQASDSIDVEVEEAVDFTIPIGGNVESSGVITGDAAVIGQTAGASVLVTGLPVGVTFQTTLLAPLSATEILVGFRITATGSAVPGIYEFQADYTLVDAGSNPLGPVTGNVFDFRIEVTP